MIRTFLWIATNMAVVLLIGVIMSILGVNTSTASGLLIFCAVFGFGGSLFSLAISRWIAKKTMGCVLIENTSNPTEQWLLNIVSSQAQQAGIAMPEVAIYESDSVNAFATGPSRDKSLIAVSSAMLNSMTKDEIEAVLGHEVSHIANGDMVTMCLLQGVLNTFVMFAARVVASIIDNALKSDEDSEGLGTFAHIGVVFLLDILFGILASFVINYYSRIREYKADAGGASLSSKSKMIAALERLKSNSESEMPGQLAAFGISGKRAGISQLLMTHPPLEKRIEALKNS